MEFLFRWLSDRPPHFHGAGKHDYVTDVQTRPGLWPVHAEVCFDWVFVNLDGTAPALQKAIAPIVERMGGYDFNGCVYAGELTFDIKTHWKLVRVN
jgi:hypothetical protein